MAVLGVKQNLATWKICLSSENDRLSSEFLWYLQQLIATTTAYCNYSSLLQLQLHLLYPAIVEDQFVNAVVNFEMILLFNHQPGQQ